MNEDVFAFLIPITLFVVSGIVLIKFIALRHAQRMAIIEKGVSGEELKLLLGRVKGQFISADSMLKWGIIAIGIGMAIIAGTQVDPQIQDEITGGLIFLLPGIGLLIYYMIFARNRKDKKPEEL